MNNIIWHYLVLFISKCSKRGVSNVGNTNIYGHIFVTLIDRHYARGYVKE